MKLKRLFSGILSILLILCMPTALTGCGTVIPNVASETLYVKKVSDIPNDFIMGMDASSVISLEKSGVKFYDFEGNEADVFKTLSENGINTIRVRVWNNPFDENGNGFGGGNCDIETAVLIGKRATQYGMNLMVDFHYSDFWADPAKQMVPLAWAGMSVDEKSDALYEFTETCLKRLSDEKIKVGMVQVGNETNGKLCGETVWQNICKLMSAGSKAVREVYPKALVAVHFANPEKGNYGSYADKLSYWGVDYDVFASSYYPYWHGTLENLTTVLGEVAEKYGKKVMVAETSYAFTEENTDFFGNTIGAGGGVTKDYPYTVQGQANSIRNIIDTVVHTKGGIGVCYWEGTWISVGQNSYEENYALWEQYGSGWASSYASVYDPDDAGKYYGGTAVDNQAMFDCDGRPLESLKVFALVRKGNETEPKADALEDVNMTVDLNGTIVLPETVNAIMTDDSKQPLAVTWNISEADYKTMYTSGPQKYDVTGTAGGMTAHCYVSMIEYNFINNYSFEDDDNKTKIPSGGWIVDMKQECNELWVEEKATDSLTGTKHFHFWADSAHKVEFTLEQEIKLNAGTYKYSISVMGGDAGNSDVYAYVKINGEIVKKGSLAITSYGKWDTVTIQDIEYNGSDTISVGIYVKCDGEGNGAWGKIDDALLNSVSAE